MAGSAASRRTHRPQVRSDPCTGAKRGPSTRVETDNAPDGVRLTRYRYVNLNIGSKTI